MALVWAMAASVRVILSARATWVVANESEVVEKVRTAVMMAKKSLVKMVMYC